MVMCFVSFREGSCQVGQVQGPCDGPLMARKLGKQFNAGLSLGCNVGPPGLRTTRATRWSVQVMPEIEPGPGVALTTIPHLPRVLFCIYRQEVGVV